jgi:hypothetical protein
MTAQRMRQHLGCVVWHARQAILEAPTGDAYPAVITDIDMSRLRDVIDEGYVREAADRETHLLPDVVEQGKQ